MKQRRLTRGISGIITVVLLIGVIAAALPTAAKGTDGGTSSAVYYSTDENGYMMYKENNSDAPLAEKDILLPGGSETLNGRGGVKTVSESGEAEYSVTVPKNALYELCITYLPLRENGGEIELSLRLDGASPFTEAGSLKLPHYYKDSGKIREDKNGDQYTPEQVDYNDFVSVSVFDETGAENDPYRFLLTEGSHTLKIGNLSESLAIAEIRLKAPAVPISYSETKNADKAESISAEPIVIEGESAARKSNRSIVSKSDTSSPAISPSSAEKQFINYIGLTSWKTPGEEAVWRFEVETAGYYDLRYIYKQDQTVNGYSYRRMKIDGKIPFAEAAEMKFYYGTSWKRGAFADDSGNPYYIWLDKGEHTLSMSATMGPTAEYYRRLKAITEGLGNLYLQITMITGDSPDSSRDYDLFKQIDGFNDTLNKYYEQCNTLAEDMKRLSGNETTSLITSIKNMARVLKSMRDNPYTAQNYVKDYYNNYTTVSSWLYDMQAMPLGIDRLIFVPCGSGYEIDMPSLLHRISFGVKRFLISFTDDYKSSGGKGGGQLKIWVNWGRDQAMVLNSLIEESFTPETGINIRLELTNASLINGILSGNAPDLSLHLARTEPVNLAMRGSLVDLTGFSDYSEVATRFGETSAVPYTYENGIYALPDTQSFYLMFYRTDIFKVLELEVPETWDDFLAVTAVLQRNNMASWIPYTQITASTTVNTGVGGLNLFASILQQNGAELYNKELNSCTLDSKLSLKAFTYWSEMYTKYKMPTTANFYNRFRIGTMPLGIEVYTQYTTLKQAAPEIDGRWAVAMAPGTRHADGTVDRTVSGAGTGCGILSASKNKEGAWEFLKWWTRADTQLKYNNNVESILGTVSRTATATNEAFEQMVWSAGDLKILKEQRAQIKEIPEVPGSYYVSRAVDQAFWSVVNGGESPKDALMKWSDIANNEIERKVEQYRGEKA